MKLILHPVQETGLPQYNPYYQLQKSLDDYGTELNNKINDLNNLLYDKSEIENNFIKLNKDKQFLLTILLRITKLFSLLHISFIPKKLP